jgi:hypothetical protein
MAGRPDGRIDWDWDRAATRLLAGPLGWGLAILYAVQVVTWVPHYLTWPWWADHDVFATMARSWDAGLRPYRDTLCNNFPGTIYLFWGLGRVFGWGNTAAFYAFDAALVVGFAGLVVAWSVRRFGRALPGLVGSGAFLSYFLGLDFSQAAQRDGQATILAVGGLLIVQGWPGRAGRLASAMAMAIGLTIRPQVAVLLPAFWPALAEARTRPRAALVEWHLALAVFSILAFLPLAMAGVLGDFLRSLRLVAYGATYNRVDLGEFVLRFVAQLDPPRFAIVPAAILAGSWALGDSNKDRRLAASWGLAMLGVLCYGPASPGIQYYLDQPRWIVWSVHVAILTQIILGAVDLAPAWRLLLVTLVIGLGLQLRPKYADAERSFGAIGLIRSGEPPVEWPSGYKHPYRLIRLYPWDDYRATLVHLRATTGPQTRVANILIGVAVAGPLGRISALPAESATWLRIVRPKDESRFIAALEQTPDSVVVWDPAGLASGIHNTLPALSATIRRLYAPRARFGDIEVWARKPGPSAHPSS